MSSLGIFVAHFQREILGQVISGKGRDGVSSAKEMIGVVGRTVTKGRHCRPDPGDGKDIGTRRNSVGNHIAAAVRVSDSDLQRGSQVIDNSKISPMALLVE